MSVTVTGAKVYTFSQAALSGSALCGRVDEVFLQAKSSMHNTLFGIQLSAVRMDMNLERGKS